MVKHYIYNELPRVVLDDIKKMLEEEGFRIAEYAPEDGFMYTDFTTIPSTMIAYWKLKEKNDGTDLAFIDSASSGSVTFTPSMKTVA